MFSGFGKGFCREFSFGFFVVLKVLARDLRKGNKKVRRKVWKRDGFLQLGIEVFRRWDLLLSFFFIYFEYVSKCCSGSKGF